MSQRQDREGRDFPEGLTPQGAPSGEASYLPAGYGSGDTVSGVEEDPSPYSRAGRSSKRAKKAGRPGRSGRAGGAGWGFGGEGRPARRPGRPVSYDEAELADLQIPGELSSRAEAPSPDLAAGAAVAGDEWQARPTYAREDDYAARPVASGVDASAHDIDEGSGATEGVAGVAAHFGQTAADSPEGLSSADEQPVSRRASGPADYDAPRARSGRAALRTSEPGAGGEPADASPYARPAKRRGLFGFGRAGRAASGAGAHASEPAVPGASASGVPGVAGAASRSSGSRSGAATGGGYEGAATMPARSQVGSSLSARSVGMPPVVTVPPTAAGWDEESRSADSAIPHSTLVSSRGASSSSDGHRGMLRVVPDVFAAPASTRLAGTGPLAAVPTAVVHDYEDIHGAGARPVLPGRGLAGSQSAAGAAGRGDVVYPWMADGAAGVPAASAVSGASGASGATGLDGGRSVRPARVSAEESASAASAPAPGAPATGAPVMPLPGEDIPAETVSDVRDAGDARRTTPRGGPLAGVFARLPLPGRAGGRRADESEARNGQVDSASVRPGWAAGAAPSTPNASQDAGRPSVDAAGISSARAAGDEAHDMHLADGAGAPDAVMPSRDGLSGTGQPAASSPDGRPFGGVPNSAAEAGVAGNEPEGPDASEGGASVRARRSRRAQSPAKEAARAARRERRVAKAQAARARRRERLPQTIVSLVASVAVVALSITMLYFPAQDLYLALRENERLTNELDANLARNEQMQTRVDNLQTQEGIEDEARERFGLVEPGENLVKVVGVDDSTRSSFATPAEIPRGSGQNTHTWGTDLLDRIFGVEVSVVSTSTSDEPAQVTEGDGVAGDSAAADAGEAAGTNGSADVAGEPADSDAGAAEGQPAEGGELAGGRTPGGDTTSAGATNANADIVVEGETPQG